MVSFSAKVFAVVVVMTIIAIGIESKLVKRGEYSRLNRHCALSNRNRSKSVSKVEGNRTTICNCTRLPLLQKCVVYEEVPDNGTTTVAPTSAQPSTTTSDQATSSAAPSTTSAGTTVTDVPSSTSSTGATDAPTTRATEATSEDSVVLP